MAFLAQVHIYCFLLGYLVGLGCEILSVFRKKSVTVRGVAMVVAIAAFVAHTAFLVVRSRKSGLPPLLASQQDWLLVLAWIGGVLYVAFSVTQRLLAHGLFLLPAMLLLITVALYVNDESAGNLHQVALRRLGMLHATSLVLGIGAVFGAVISALMYLLNHQRLRSRSGWLQRISLPSLENLTSVNRWMVILSVPFLTLGLITGFLLIPLSRSADTRMPVPWTDPTILTTVVVWILMVLVLIRLLSRSRQTGKFVAQLSLLSGGFLLVTVFGPMLLASSGNIKTFHTRPSEVSAESSREASAAGSLRVDPENASPELPK